MKFRVIYRYETSIHICVEAENETEATKLADEEFNELTLDEIENEQLTNIDYVGKEVETS